MPTMTAGAGAGKGGDALTSPPIPEPCWRLLWWPLVVASWEGRMGVAGGAAGEEEGGSEGGVAAPPTICCNRRQRQLGWEGRGGGWRGTAPACVPPRPCRDGRPPHRRCCNQAPSSGAGCRLYDCRLHRAREGTRGGHGRHGSVPRPWRRSVWPVGLEPQGKERKRSCAQTEIVKVQQACGLSCSLSQHCRHTGRSARSVSAATVQYGVHTSRLRVRRPPPAGRGQDPLRHWSRRGGWSGPPQPPPLPPAPRPRPRPLRAPAAPPRA